jgi:hypothetical protein
MAVLAVDAEHERMKSADRYHDPGALLLAAAQCFQATTEPPGSHEVAPCLVASLEAVPG